MTETVLLYTRVSSDKQEQDGTSLDTQLAAERERVAERGYQIIGEFTDTWTGAEYRERPGLTQLREMVRAGGVDVVLCYALDRLSRDQVHLGVIVDEIEYHGARLELVTESFEDTAVGKFIRSASAFAAEVEHEKIIGRTTNGRRERAAKGKLISRPKALYGYRFKDDDHGAYVVNDPEARILRRMVAECLSGRSLSRIKAGLNADAISTPSGRGQWSHTTIHRLLTSREYTGVGTSWRGEFALAEGTIPAIINAAEFAAVRDRLRHNKQFSTRNTINPEEALLRGGFIRCGHCGRVVQVERQRNGAAYRCKGHPDRPGDCPGVSMLAKVLDPIIWEQVDAVIGREDVIERELERLLHDDPSVHDLEAVERTIRQVERQRTNLQQTVEQLSHPDAIATLAHRLDECAAHLAQLELEREAVGQRRDQWRQAQQRLADLREWCRKVAAQTEGFSWERKRLALTALGVEVVLYKHGWTPRFELTLALPLDVPLDIPVSHTTCLVASPPGASEC